VQKEAKFYKKEPVGKTRCLLCPHRCFLANNKAGVCKIRVNKDGILYDIAYGEISTYAMDPIEKKPLYHFYPGSEIFSIGTWGCNFKCTFCQNWSISQQQVPTEIFTSEEIVDIAIKQKSLGIAYTYNEPFIWYEFVYDTAKMAKQKGLKNVLVTNGFVNEDPLREILPLIDALNIDLKANNESFYREICGGQLPPVMRTIKLSFNAGKHVEITNLLIPTLNDKDEEIESIVDWLAGISKDIPLHFSRYYPQYLMNIEPTDIATLNKAYNIAKQKLNYVYTGNVPLEQGQINTVCPNCKKELIKRDLNGIKISGLEGNACQSCKTSIYGQFE